MQNKRAILKTTRTGTPLALSIKYMNNIIDTTINPTCKWSKLLSMISTRHGKYASSRGSIAGAWESVASHNCMVMPVKFAIIN